MSISLSPGPWQGLGIHCSSAHKISLQSILNSKTLGNPHDLMRPRDITGVPVLFGDFGAVKISSLYQMNQCQGLKGELQHDGSFTRQIRYPKTWSWWKEEMNHWPSLRHPWVKSCARPNNNFCSQSSRNRNCSLPCRWAELQRFGA